MKNKLICLAATLATLFACSNDDKDKIQTGGDGALRFRSTINAPASENVYLWGDEVVGGSVNTYFNAWQLKTRGGIGLKETVSKYFPKSGNLLNIYAMHGNFVDNALVAETTPFPAPSIVHNVKDVQVEASDYAISDLYYSSTHSVEFTPSETTLAFYHMLSRIEVVIGAGDGFKAIDLEGARIRIVNTKLKVDFSPKKIPAEDLADLSVRGEMLKLAATNNEVKPITIATKIAPDGMKNLVTAEHSNAVIVPQTVNGDFIEVQFGADKKTLYYKVENMKFECGTKYIFNITVNSSSTPEAAELAADVEAIDWETGEFIIPRIGEIKDPKLSKVGDYSMSDGSFVSKDKELTPEQIAACVGIVFWRENPSVDDASLRREHPQCKNGLIVALKDAASYVKWQGNPWCFVGKDWIQYNVGGLYIHPTTMYGPKENLHKMLGYNNTMGIDIYNRKSGKTQVVHVQKIMEYAAAVPAPRNSSGWFLPSAKELAVLRTGTDVQDIFFSDNLPEPTAANVSLIEAQLKKLPAANAIPFKRYFYASSTEHGCGNGSMYSIYLQHKGDPKPWYVGEGKKSYMYYSRAVCAF